MTASSPSIHSSSYPLVVLIATSIASFMTPFDGSVVNLAIPSIGISLKASLAYVIWIPTVYLVVVAIMETTMGRLGDLRGRKKLFVISIAIFTTGSLIAGLSSTIYQLIFARIVQGLGSAGMDACGLSLLAQAFPVLRRGKAFGINAMVVYIGASVGPSAGGFLVQYFGWRSIFFVNVPIGIAGIALTLISVKKDVITNRLNQGFDSLGAITLASFLGTLLLILNQGDFVLSFAESIALYISCLASFAVFVYVESRVAERPLVDLELFTRNRLFAGGMATALASYVTTAGSILIISIYLQSVLGLSPINAGLILLIQPILMAASAPIAGSLSDRISARVLTSVGMLSKSVGFFLLAFLGIHSSPDSLWLPLILIGAGHGFFSSPNVNSVMSAIRSSEFGIASGALGTIRTAGQSIGIAMMGAIVAAQIGSSASSLYGSTTLFSEPVAMGFVIGMRSAFLVVCVISTFGVFTSLLRGKPVEPEDLVPG
ncbi:MAG: MFS transporter [Nitrososphaerales archaeon]